MSMPYDGLFHFYATQFYRKKDKKKVSMPYDGLFHFYFCVMDAVRHLHSLVSMPYDGLFHFYRADGVSGCHPDDVSMPYDGLFHFYKRGKEDIRRSDVCQCPMTGFFISTNMEVKEAA